MFRTIFQRMNIVTIVEKKVKERKLVSFSAKEKILRQLTLPIFSYFTKPFELPQLQSRFCIMIFNEFISNITKK